MPLVHPRQHSLLALLHALCLERVDRGLIQDNEPDMCEQQGEREEHEQRGPASARQYLPIRQKETGHLQRYDHNKLGIDVAVPALVDYAGNKGRERPHAEDHRPLQKMYKKLHSALQSD